MIDEDKKYYRLLREEFSSFPSYPENNYSGRGIVLCAGGLSFLSNAYVCLKFIRKFSNLPVELFYSGRGEMPASVMEQLTRDFSSLRLLDITSPDFAQQFPFLRPDDFRGCQIKTFAILYSSFREVLYIDADNIILQSPDLLFGLPEYCQTGALFWPDLASMKTTQKNLLELFGLDPDTVSPEPEFESGQILINKETCWQALLTVCLVNSGGHDFRRYCYRHTLGDKDTFRLAFRFARTDYNVIGHLPLRIGNDFIIKAIPYTDIVLKIQHRTGSFYGTGILQYDPAGEPLFVHKTICEWNIYTQFPALAYLEKQSGQLEKDPELTAIDNEGYRYLALFKKDYLPKFGGDYPKMLLGILNNIAVALLNILPVRKKNY